MITKPRWMVWLLLYHSSLTNKRDFLHSTRYCLSVHLFLLSELSTLCPCTPIHPAGRVKVLIHFWWSIFKCVLDHYMALPYGSNETKGLVLIPNNPSQALESITNITNVNSLFLWTANTLFLDEAAADIDNLPEESLYRIASVAKSLMG